MGTVLGLQDSIELIREFYPAPLPFRGGTQPGLCEALERQKLLRFPDEFRDYLHRFVPSSGLRVNTIGDPIALLSASRIGWRMPGYNYNTLTQRDILSWKSNWFLFAICGRDPIIINCHDLGETSTVYRAMYAPNLWSFRPIADSIGQFLYCICAIEHALCRITSTSPVIDDDRGFRLEDAVADWLFPRIDTWANKYYEDWLCVFDNA